MRIRLRRKRGILFVVSGPSGVGKGTILKRVMDTLDGLNFSVSVTTRSPRPGEVHGKHYFFISVSEFLRLRDSGELLEWAQVHGNFYGTPKDFVLSKLTRGEDVIMDIDVQGGKQIMEKFRDAVTIFVLPPSLSELKRRLENRGTDTKEQIELRLKNAIWELNFAKDYKYVIVNDELDKATEKLRAIIIAERHLKTNLELEVSVAESELRDIQGYSTF